MTWPLTCGSIAVMTDHDSHKTKVPRVIARAGLPRIHQRSAIYCDGRLFRRRRPPATGETFLRPGRRGTQPRDDAGAVSARPRCAGRDPRCRRSAQRVRHPAGRAGAGAGSGAAVTEQVSRLAAVARDEGDYLGEQFVQWFLKEQVEEMALMTSLGAGRRSRRGQPVRPGELRRPGNRLGAQRGRRARCRRRPPLTSAGRRR